MQLIMSEKAANINRNSDKSINELWQLQIKLKSEYKVAVCRSHTIKLFNSNISSQVIAAEGEQKVGKIFFMIFVTIFQTVCRPAEPWGQPQMSSLNLQRLFNWDISRFCLVLQRRKEEGLTSSVFLSIFEVPTDKFENVLTSYILIQFPSEKIFSICKYF